MDSVARREAREGQRRPGANIWIFTPVSGKNFEKQGARVREFFGRPVAAAAAKLEVRLTFLGESA